MPQITRHNSNKPKNPSNGDLSGKLILIISKGRAAKVNKVSQAKTLISVCINRAFKFLS